jgi:hypothetical protein
MGPIFEAVLHFFEDDRWDVAQLDGEPVLSMNVAGQNGQWRCVAKSREEQKQFIFYSVCGTSAPEHRRQAVAEFVTRANSGMVIGNFELDFNDGEIRYKTSMIFEGVPLAPALIKNLVYANVLMMDRYLPAITQVIEGTASPQAAVASLES